jgi:hypothetical protein
LELLLPEAPAELLYQFQKTTAQYIPIANVAREGRFRAD